MTSGVKRFKSWIVIYFVLAAAIVVTNRGSSVDLEVLSPVSLDTLAPAIAVDALVQRSDI